MAFLVLAICLGLAVEEAPRALLRDPDPDRRVRGVRLIAAENSLGAAKELLRLHGDPHRRVRGKGLEALAEISDPDARTWLIEVGLSERKPSARRMAALALGRMRERGAVAPLIGLLGDPSAEVRAGAVVSLGRLGAGEASGEVGELLHGDRSWEVRAEAAGTLGQLRGVEAVADLEKAWRDSDPRVRIAILEALGGAGRRTALEALKDSDWRVRCTATEVLARLGGREVVGPLIEALEVAEGRTIRDLIGALGRITGRRLGADILAWKTWWEANGSRWVGPSRSSGMDRPRQSRERATYYDIPIWSERVVFVIDLSQSMRETSGTVAGIPRVEAARRELGRALDALPPTSRFNVITFRSEPKAIARRPIRARAANVAACLRWIGDPAGGTNLHDALEMAIQSGGGDTVFLLSDGAPSCGVYRNKTEILQSVRQMNRFRKVRIHAIGIGSQAVSNRWRGLLEGLAEATDGEYVSGK